MLKDRTVELEARIRDYEERLKLEQKLNRQYRAQLKYARSQGSKRSKLALTREIEREIQLQQDHLGYGHLTKNQFKRLVKASDFKFQVIPKNLCGSTPGRKLKRKSTRWLRLREIRQLLTWVPMTILRGLTQLCTIKTRKVCSKKTVSTI